MWEEPALTRTGEDGTFQIASLSPEDHLVSAGVANTAAGVAEIPPFTNGEAWVEIILPKEGGRIEGIVLAAGEPVPLCSVRAHPVGGAGYAHNHAARTDENGRFLLEGLPEFDIEVSVGYHEPATGPWKTRVWLARTVTVENDQTTAMSLEFPAGDFSLEGRVVFEGEGAFTYASVHVIIDREDTQVTWHGGEAKDDGAYRLGGLLAGESELHVAIRLGGEYLEYVEPIVLPGSGTLRLNVHVDGEGGFWVEPIDS